ncbi:MAG: 3,4-dioxygenase subunit beta [Aeromicrobium sp.]|uniref:dioxygenase family protein n=1 Tax=Aeromicrobium sp. TaxID=1871063 RepID=UPI0039E6CB86
MSNLPEPETTPLGPAYEGRLLPRPDDDLADQGAAFDVTTLVTRRRLLGLLGLGAGSLALAACGGGSSSSSGTASATTTNSSSATSAGTADGEIPQETNGPYPADGTNGVNVLEESGIVRRDITASLDGGTVAEGTPLSFTFTITDMANGDVPFAGAAVYLWQCDAQGQYSMYTEAIAEETYLRGVQVADADGNVTFDTIVPGCYSGRWTHMHFEVYPDVDSATDVANAIATSQVAFPQDMLDAVYAESTYDGSSRNLSQIGSMDNDNVFGDGHDLELGTFSGDVASGYVGSLAVGVDTTTEASAGSPGGGSGGGPGGGGGGGQAPGAPN